MDENTEGASLACKFGVAAVAQAALHVAWPRRREAGVRAWGGRAPFWAVSRASPRRARSGLCRTLRALS
mgnify:CR=1 FL=1